MLIRCLFCIHFGSLFSLVILRSCRICARWFCHADGELLSPYIALCNLQTVCQESLQNSCGGHMNKSFVAAFACRNATEISCFDCPLFGHCNCEKDTKCAEYWCACVNFICIFNLFSVSFCYYSCSYLVSFVPQHPSWLYYCCLLFRCEIIDVHFRVNTLFLHVFNFVLHAFYCFLLV